MFHSCDKPTINITNRANKNGFFVKYGLNVIDYLLSEKNLVNIFLLNRKVLFFLFYSTIIK